MAFLWFIIGAILGSFYLVVGTRVPKKEDFITSRSKCDYCQKELRWFELIPVISYVIQLGKCRNCGKRISPSYLFMEVITGLLFLIGFLYYGMSISYYIYLVSISLALIIFVSDFKYMVILDSTLVIASIILLVLRYFEVGIQGTLYSCLYGLILFIIMFLIRLLGNFLFKKDSLGGGDIKLAIYMGILLGYYNYGLRLGIIAIMFSAFLALPYALVSLYLNKKNELPYGPFLISAAIIVFVFIDKFKNLLILFSL